MSSRQSAFAFNILYIFGLWCQNICRTYYVFTRFTKNSRERRERRGERPTRLSIYAPRRSILQVKNICIVPAVGITGIVVWYDVGQKEVLQYSYSRSSRNDIVMHICIVAINRRLRLIACDLKKKKTTGSRLFAI